MQMALRSISGYAAKIEVDRRFAYLIIGLGLLIRIPRIWYTSELWRPEDTASIAHFFYKNGFNILYPQIFWGGSGPGYVESEFQLYPFLVALLYSVFGEQVFLGRFLSFLFAAATIVAFYLLAQQLLTQREAIWSLVLFVFSPIMVRYDTAFMPEATMMCFYVGGLYFFTRWLDRRRLLFLVLASLSTCLAILVKPSAIHVGLLFALLAISRFGLRSLLRDWRIWLASLLCLVPVILYFWHAHRLYLEYGNTFGVLLAGDSKFGNISIWLSPEFYLGLAATERWYVFTPVGVLVFVLGFWHAIRRRFLFLLFAVATILLYYFITARYSGYSRGIQYHIYMVPYAALGFGIGVEALFSMPKHRLLGKTLSLAVILAVILYSARAYPRLVQTGVVAPFLTCATTVQKHAAVDSLIIVGSPSISADNQNIPENYQEPTVFFYSQRKGWSLPADWWSATKLEELRQAGAEYFVILDRDLPLLRANSAFAEHLDTARKRLDSGGDSGCRIYQLD